MLETIHPLQRRRGINFGGGVELDGDHAFAETWFAAVFEAEASVARIAKPVGGTEPRAS